MSGFRRPLAVYDHPFCNTLAEKIRQMTPREFSDFKYELGGAMAADKSVKHKGAYHIALTDLIEGKAIPDISELRILSEVTFGSSSQGPGRQFIEDGLDFISHRQHAEQVIAGSKPRNKAIDPEAVKDSRSHPRGRY